MEMRVFGRTGMQLSVLGFGCGAVGGLMVRGDPLDQERTIARAGRTLAMLRFLDIMKALG
jgi:L-galactose dehydrogenase/L-glyceraldehyde 3-phosphate reductase